MAAFPWSIGLREEVARMYDDPEFQRRAAEIWARAVRDTKDPEDMTREELVAYVRELRERRC